MIITILLLILLLLLLLLLLKFQFDSTGFNSAYYNISTVVPGLRRN